VDKHRIDSHKLIFHVPRVNEWLSGGNVYPIYMEVSPAGACNHRCTYCGLDFMEYQPRYLNTDILKKRLLEMGNLGLKSIMYAGEGEPFLHKDIADIVNYTKASGIDVAITTNGVLFKKEMADSILASTEWMKISINGATRQTYAKIHCCREEDFDKMRANLEYAVKLKKTKGYKCTIGMQLLLLPDNAHEAVMLAELARDMEMDYLVIKPYSQHPQSKTKVYSKIKYSDYEYLQDEFKKLNTDDFRIIFRVNTMKKWDNASKDYKKCLALPFWSYIDAGGDVWGCSVYLGNERFLYGNINNQTFSEIWESQKRKASLEWVEEELDPCNCRINCRMDEINNYLWQLKNLPEHANFI